MLEHIQNSSPKSTLVLFVSSLDEICGGCNKLRCSEKKPRIQESTTNNNHIFFFILLLLLFPHSFPFPIIVSASFIFLFFRVFCLHIFLADICPQKQELLFYFAFLLLLIISKYSIFFCIITDWD